MLPGASCALGSAAGLALHYALSGLGGHLLQDLDLLEDLPDFTGTGIGHTDLSDFMVP